MSENLNIASGRARNCPLSLLIPSPDMDNFLFPDFLCLVTVMFIFQKHAFMSALE